VSLDGLVGATTLPVERLCTACFTGSYPIEIPDPHLIGKHVLEGIEKNVARGNTDPDGLDLLLVAGGAEDALSRP